MTDCGKWEISFTSSVTRAKYYSPTENLTVDEIIVPFKGKVIFKQYIPKKHRWCGIKIYKLCDSKEYTSDMSVY
jgi:hypothetical protein